MKAEELDEISDAGEDITPYLNFDFQASLMGITRQAVIRLWVAERLRKELLQQKKISLNQTA